MTAQDGENKWQGHLKISPHKDSVSNAKDNCGGGVRRHVLPEHKVKGNKMSYSGKKKSAVTIINAPGLQNNEPINTPIDVSGVHVPSPC